MSCYAEYREAMVQHLIRRKLEHWDRALRELASKALAAIVKQDPEYFAESVLAQLVSLCTDPCVEVIPSITFLFGFNLQGQVRLSLPPRSVCCSDDCLRCMNSILDRRPLRLQVLHGALLGTAELILALAAVPRQPDSSLLQRVVAVAPNLAKARLYRGRCAELLRAGACRCDSLFR